MTSSDLYQEWLGIPLEDQPPNNYRLLDLQLFEPDSDLIEQAVQRRSLAVRRQLRTNKLGDGQSLLDAIADAQLCLTTPALKRAYDVRLRLKHPDFVPLQTPVSTRAIVPVLGSASSVQVTGISRDLLNPHSHLSWAKLTAFGALCCVLTLVGVYTVTSLRKRNPQAQKVARSEPPDFMPSVSKRPLPLPPVSVPDAPASVPDVQESVPAIQVPDPTVAAAESIPEEPKIAEAEQAGPPVLPAPQDPPLKLAKQAMKIDLPPPAAATSSKEQFETLVVLYKRRNELLRLIKTLDEQVTTLQTQNQELRKRSLAAQKSVAEASSAISFIDMQVAIATSDSDRNTMLQRRIGWQQQFQIGIALAIELKSLCSTMTGKLFNAKSEREKMSNEVYETGQEWLQFVDPLGKSTSTEHESALEVLNKWIVLDDSFPLPYIARGLSLLELDRFEEAQADFDRALTLDRSLKDAVAGRGLLKWKQGMQKESLADMRSSQPKGKGGWLLCLCQGRMHYDQANYSKAIANLDQAVRCSGKNPTAYLMLARIYATCPDEKFRDATKAIQLVESARELSQENSWRQLDTLAAAQAEANNFDEAVKFQTQAVEAAPTEAKAECKARLKLYEQNMPYRDR